AMRVLADHIRAISFAIADGQLPSNNGAGYVIRRILRRAVRYQYQFLNIKEPFLCKLAVLIADSFKNVFPELFAQKDFVVKVIKEEEQSFLKTLGAGINELYSSIEEIQKTQREIEKQLEASKKVAELYAENNKQLEAVNSFKSSVLSITQSLAFKYQGSFDSLNKAISNIDDITKAAKLVGDFKPMLSGSASFILQDEKGFPIDLTRLISKEKGIDVDIEGFEAALQQQKERSRKATELTTDDWVPGRPDSLGAGVHDNTEEHYSRTESQQQNYITQYRKVTKGKETQYQLVIMDNIFYPEGGGQVGDVGKLVFVNETIEVINTIKENGLPILIVNKLPDNPKDYFQAFIDVKRRQLTANNHSATHLLHAALRKVLGTHVQQKGSLVNHEYLRFDFAHFSAMTEEELAQVEHLVNEKIRENIIVHTDPKVAISDAQKMGAMMLFGEKYGEVVRVVTMDENYSRELCGGTHVKATGQIGYFKIVSESAVAAGVRRIEAITADAAETLINQQFALVNELKDLLKAKDLAKSVEQLLQEKAELSKKLEAFEAEKTVQLKNELKQKVTSQSNGNVLIERVTVSSAEQLKNLSFQLRNEIENLFCVLGCELNGKPMLSVMISDNLVADNKLHAGNIVKELAKHIQGGGGGQPFYATAGGNNSNGLADALAKAKTILA
ncbi:MAG: alanine--tRNA ligase-related protein, partial [Bacteroidota bacterium]